MPDSPRDLVAKIRAYYVATTERSLISHWGQETLGLHFGLDDGDTESLAESLLNTNRFLAQRAGVGPGTRVLDAGCGVGGSALWLTSERDAAVVGITLVPEQVELAKRYASERGLGDRVDFECKDMLNTGFESGAFDVVWNIESLCHVADVDAYLRHVGYLLADGGRFVCSELCLGPKPDPDIERTVCDGWAMVPLRTPQRIAEAARLAGFVEVEVADLTQRAMSSAHALRAGASRAALALRVEREFLDKHEPEYEAHVRAGLAMVDGLERGATCIGHVRAVWPGESA